MSRLPSPIMGSLTRSKTGARPQATSMTIRTKSYPVEIWTRSLPMQSPPMLTAYRQLGWDIADFPNAYRQFADEITLPLHTRLTDEDVAYIIRHYREILT